MKRLLLILLAAMLCAPFSSAREKEYAVVNLPVNFLRLEPDYESPLETQVLMGTVVEVLARDGYWVKVRTPEPYEAWCTELGLTFFKDEKDFRSYYKDNKLIAVARHFFAYEDKSGKEDKILGPIIQGDILRLVRSADSNGMVKIKLPDGRSGFVREENVEPLSKWAKRVEATPENLAKLAISYLGTPYMWGGASVNAFDCSGLIRQVFYMNGILLPRNAREQIFCGEPVNTYDDLEVPDSTASIGSLDRYWLKRTKNLRKGDLLFFGRVDEDGERTVTHVGMYLGDGEFIHSSHLVRISSFNPGTDNMYENAHKFIGACRIVDKKGYIILEESWDEKGRSEGFKAQYIDDLL